MKRLLFALLISICLCNCSEDDSNQFEEQTTIVQTAVIPTNASANIEFEIEFEIKIPDGCWTFSRIEKNESENEILITVYIKNENLNDFCLTAFFTKNITERIIIGSIGDKVIKFNDSEIEYNIQVE